MAAALSATVVLATLSPASSARADEQPATLTIMTPEEYQANYLKLYGRSAPSDLSAVPTTPVPDRILNGGVLVDTTHALTFDRAAGAASSGTVSPMATDPGGGGGGSVPWWTVLYSYVDQKKNRVFVRYGNAYLGFDHFASKHNLHNQVVFQHLMATKPRNTSGARLEYLLLVADPSNGKVAEKITIISQQATKTDDRRWTTPDGGYVGVITAFCQGKTKCPNWVNNLKK